MTEPFLSACDLELIRCNTRAELSLARQFRNDVFIAKRGIEFDSVQERRRDVVSHVLLLTQHGKPCATARVQPYPTTGTLAEIAPKLPGFGADSEVGRIAATRSTDCAAYSLLLLVLGSMWVLTHTPHRRYVAYCHPKLLPLYGLIGSRDTGMSIEVAGRSHTHCVLVGEYESCAEVGLARLRDAGFTGQDAAAAVRWHCGNFSDGQRVMESAS
ncbi:MAG: hypothetical protein JOZ00_12765 [Mycobacterium sp.]|uniref:hypothetical protein n=1 Tax=Mycobacterium sp. TaxID=1785 RepID=UPI001ECF90F8|nr:hypothetical protein [Mycobacterium sp.]MBV8787547.1 hypothetical protein [Mycobacterium sp.]